MKSVAAKEAILQFLQLIPESKRKEMVAIDAGSLGIDMLYHMSRDNDIRQFSPSISKRTAIGEDRSIPRISTALDWAGCVIGYQSDINDFARRGKSNNASGDLIEFKGGWIIYGLPFEYALRPGPSLVPDQARSGEHWLVTYDQLTIEFKPQKLAKVFYESVDVRATSATSSITIITAVFEVLPGATLRLGSGYLLTPGFYRVRTRDLHQAVNHREVVFTQIKVITEAEYLSAKGCLAGLLSIDNPVPPSQSW